MIILNFQNINASYSDLQPFFSIRPILSMKARLSCFFICLFFPGAAFSDEPVGPPDWMKDITRLPPGGHADLRAVELEYTLDWNHRVNAGKVEIAIMRDGPKKDKFVGDANGGSTGFARLLFPYDFRARSIVDQDSLRPLTFQLTEKDRSEENSYDIIFESKRQIYTTTSKRKTETLSATSRFKFDFGQDVLSSAFYLRGQPLKDGDSITMLVTPFNRPYLASFKVVGRESHEVKGTTYEAIRLDATVGKVNQDLTIKSYEKIKRTTLWFTDDEYRIPLELQAHLTFGYVSARLDEKKWLE